MQEYIQKLYIKARFNALLLGAWALKPTHKRATKLNIRKRRKRNNLLQI